jgi:crossover junction endodeoxyribonuclease RusA
LLPFEFVVEGVPVSAQAKNSLKWWKQKVFDAAKLAWPSTDAPIKDEMQVVITYFYDLFPVGDTDNIIKPIQDALIGLIYTDDHQIADIRARRLDVRIIYPEQNVSPIVKVALDKKQSFVHIKLNAPLDKMRLEV